MSGDGTYSDCQCKSGCVRNYPNLFPDSQIVSYVSRVGATSTRAAWIPKYTLSCLRCNRMSFTEMALDCPPGPGNTLTGVVGGGSVVSKALAGAAAPAAIAVPIVGQILGVLAGIFAHHAQAVAREQSTICDVLNKYNTFADSIEPAIASGQLDVNDATIALQNASSQLQSELAGISNASQENAGWGIAFGLRSLQLFNTEVIYPRLKPGVVQQIANTAASVASSPNGVLYLAAGVVGAKVLGVF